MLICWKVSSHVKIVRTSRIIEGVVRERICMRTLAIVPFLVLFITRRQRQPRRRTCGIRPRSLDDWEAAWTSISSPRLRLRPAMSAASSISAHTTELESLYFGTKIRITSYCGCCHHELPRAWLLSFVALPFSTARLSSLSASPLSQHGRQLRRLIHHLLPIPLSNPLYWNISCLRFELELRVMGCD